MVIANVTPDGRIEVIDRVKEMVRLGKLAFTTGQLSPETMALASRALKTFGRLARVRRVERLRVVATSAVREARNGAADPDHLRPGGGAADLPCHAACPRARRRSPPPGRRRGRERGALPRPG